VIEDSGTGCLPPGPGTVTGQQLALEETARPARSPFRLWGAANNNRMTAKSVLERLERRCRARRLKNLTAIKPYRKRVSVLPNHAND